jgi:hypothetical protein
VDLLRELAEREVGLMEHVDSLVGLMEDKERQLAEPGDETYAQYAAIHEACAGLAGPPDMSLEALKRAIFLGWYADAEPSCFTGIANLHEGAVSLTHDLLRVAWADGRLDEEFEAMLGWYWSMPPCDFAGSPATDEFARYLSRLSPEAYLSQNFSQDDLMTRGQMGRYWIDIVFRPAQQALVAEGVRARLRRTLRLR